MKKVGRALNVLFGGFQTSIWKLKGLSLYSEALTTTKVDLHNPLEALLGLPTKDAYLTCHRNFYRLPLDIRRLRWYFRSSQRGFGEDAFFFMWYALIKAGSPAKCLEVGVYRGQVLALWTLLGRILGSEIQVTGISPLSSAADEVSDYPDLDYRSDITESFRILRLPLPRLVEGLSSSPEVQRQVKNEKFDLVYIDGSHEYATVKQDVLTYGAMLSSQGLIVLDDASLFDSSTLPKRAFRGHPGPSRVCQEMGSLGFETVLRIGHNVVFRKAIDSV